MRSLAVCAGPLTVGVHRFHQFWRVHRFALFAKNLQGRSDAAQALLIGVCGLGGYFQASAFRTNFTLQTLAATVTATERLPKKAGKCR